MEHVMIHDKRRLQFSTAAVLTALLIAMGFAWATHALALYRSTLERQMAEDNDIVKANLGIIIHQATQQYADRDMVRDQIQNVLEALQAPFSADYARALQLAYRATAVDPKAPGPALLAGLIYDRVFDRPDLALLEYDRLQRLSPPRPELEILELRLQYLLRRAQSLSASQALKPGSSPPLREVPLALFPF